MSSRYRSEPMYNVSGANVLISPQQSDNRGEETSVVARFPVRAPLRLAGTLPAGWVLAALAQVRVGYAALRQWAKDLRR